MRVTDNRRFHTLDGWRGICALLIALHHFPAHGFLYHLPLVRNAWLLVDFFFVLSGFVIAHAYGARLSTFAATKNFAIRRFFRLWPLHAALLATFILLEFYRLAATGEGFAGDRSVFAIFTNLALIQSLGVHDRLTWNTPAWAVSTEFWTTLLFAVVAFATARARVVVSAFLLVLSVAVLALHSRYGMRETFDWGIARCIYGFFLGALVYEAWARQWFAWFTGNLAEIFALAVALAFLLFVPGYRSLEYLAPPVFALFVVAFASDSGLLARVFSSAALQALGRWSYAIYLVQMLVIALIVSALDSLAPGHTAIGADGNEFIRLGFADDTLMLVYLAVVVGIAAIAWRVVEVPGQMLGTRLTARNIAASQDASIG